MIEDDGHGLNGSKSGNGLGLIGMRERVMAMAGSLVIRPGRSGNGLSLVVRLPCEHSQHADVRE